jgi:uncharacterized membrane protein
MLAWGAVVVAVWVVSVAVGMLGLIVAVPVVGHATWHVYKAIR